LVCRENYGKKKKYIFKKLLCCFGRWHHHEYPYGESLEGELNVPRIHKDYQRLFSAIVSLIVTT